MKKKSCSRRSFVIDLSKMTLGAALYAYVLQSCNKTPAEIFGDDEETLKTINVKNDYPELSEIGGSVYIELGTGSYPLVAYRKSTTEIVVVTSECTHQSVQVDLPDKTGVLQCPGDGALFDMSKGGKAITPNVTPMDLKKLNALFSGDTLTVYKD